MPLRWILENGKKNLNKLRFFFHIHPSINPNGP